MTTSHTNTVYALLAGIAAYKNLSSLKKTTTDASDLRELLIESGYLADNLILLRDEKATKVAISNALDWLACTATPQDTVLIFFSGHGVQRHP